jgi:Subtilase family
MTKRMRPTAASTAAAALAAFALLCCGQASAAGEVSPLPLSDYTARSVCAPPAPGDVTCMALELIARSAEARAHTHPLGMTRSVERSAPSPAAGNFGLRPQDLHSAYVLPVDTPGTQTIALVDVYNDLTAEADLEAYDTEFGLPRCTKSNGCFTKVNQKGETANLPFPASAEALKKANKGSRSEIEEAEEAEGWTVEISLDIETAHATCQNCRIALVEASSPSYANLDAAETAAVALGANEVSNSWGGPECGEGGAGVECVPDSSAFDHPGVVITASAGDDGYLNWLEEPRSAYANFPASSPQVVAVGGTRLSPLGPSGEWTGERVWNDGGENEEVKEGHGAGGGGCSIQFAAQPWQRDVSDWSSVGCGNDRAVADVAADADPYSGLAVYDSSSPRCTSEYEEELVRHTVPHWCTIGGTSLASPLVASVFALAGGAQGVEYPARTLYRNAAKSPATLHDVSEGSNGECLLPFNENAQTTECLPFEEAASSCSSQLICQAAAGYDGPTGVGTPDGIAAFQPVEGAGREEEGEDGEEEATNGSGGKSKVKSKGAGPPPASPAPASPQPAPPPSLELSDLALSLKAAIARNSGRLKITQVGFTFDVNMPAHVLVALQKRVVKHKHVRWVTVMHPHTIVAAAGLNSQHLAKRSDLASGTYRLTLTPVQAAARSIVFKLG